MKHCSGKWTIEISDFPNKTSIQFGFFPANHGLKFKNAKGHTFTHHFLDSWDRQVSLGMWSSRVIDILVVTRKGIKCYIAIHIVNYSDMAIEMT